MRGWWRYLFVGVGRLFDLLIRCTSTNYKGNDEMMHSHTFIACLREWEVGTLGRLFAFHSEASLAK
jgi:hypothetical protein